MTTTDMTLREKVARAIFDTNPPFADSAETERAWMYVREEAHDAADAAIAIVLEAAAEYVEGKGGVIPGSAVFGTLVSGNPMPDMSGDPRNRMLPHIRRRFDDATRELGNGIRNLGRTA